MANRARLKVLEVPAPQEALREAVESFLRRGQARNLSHHTLRFYRTRLDAFTLQKLLGHSDLAMTRRYCEVSQTDAVAKHRQCSPGDRFLGAVQKAGGRKRLR